MLPRIAVFLSVASLAAGIPNVMLLYESLCRACEQEMKIDVTEALQKFGDNVFFSLVPYGNAKTTIGPEGSLQVKCQHGENECIGNAWHACSHLYMTPRERVEYAICTMTQADENIINHLKECTTAENAAVLQPCAEGPMGVALIKLMADITDTAGAVWNNSTRRLDGVPTIFIDGFPVSYFDMNKYTLSELICLKAKVKPENC